MKIPVKLGTPPSSTAPSPRWYQGISRYQWLVLIIASAGWVFDIYEGQIFNTTRDDLLGEMIVADSPAEHQAAVKSVGDAFLGIFLAGGMVGGVLFGALGDRWGRKPAMILTILMYSVFSGLTYFRHVALAGRRAAVFGIDGYRRRMGRRPRRWWPTSFHVTPGPQASSVFQASSTLGTWMAAMVAIAIGSQWRYGYLVGVLPAVLILFIRSRLDEPAAWKQLDSGPPKKKGSLIDLFGDVQWRGRAIGGVLLAAVGLAMFWGVTSRDKTWPPKSPSGAEPIRQRCQQHGKIRLRPRASDRRRHRPVGVWPVVPMDRPQEGLRARAVSGHGDRAVCLLCAAAPIRSFCSFCPSMGRLRWRFTPAMPFIFPSCFRRVCERWGRAFASMAAGLSPPSCCRFPAM